MRRAMCIARQYSLIRRGATCHLPLITRSQSLVPSHVSLVMTHDANSDEPEDPCTVSATARLPLPHFRIPC